MRKTDCFGETRLVPQYLARYELDSKSIYCCIIIIIDIHHHSGAHVLTWKCRMISLLLSAGKN